MLTDKEIKCCEAARADLNKAADCLVEAVHHFNNILSAASEELEEALTYYNAELAETRKLAALIADVYADDEQAEAWQSFADEDDEHELPYTCEMVIEKPEHADEFAALWEQNTVEA